MLTNAPPMHPRCRSTISAVISEGTRTARVKGKNIRVPAEMSYHDYKRVYVDKKISLKDWQENKILPRGIISGTLIQGASEVKLSKANQIIKDAEDAAFKAQTGADFGFKKMSGEPDWGKEISYANGDGEGIGRKINCQRCVVAHEARMRGYDVIARMSWGVGDPMLKIPEWLKVFESDKLDIKEFTGKNTEAAINSAKKIMKSFGTGARAFIWFNWENIPNLWHVIVAECRGDNVVVFGDPQRRVTAASKYFAEANLKSLKIMRVDNLKFTDNVKRCCVNKE